MSISNLHRRNGSPRTIACTCVLTCLLAASLLTCLPGCGRAGGELAICPAPPDAPPGSEYYDTDADGQADVAFLPDATGRLVTMADLRDGHGPPRLFDLQAAPIHVSRHLVIILDGVGYEVAAEHYRRGGLRLFHPPSRVVAPYPTLTDLCMEDVLDYVPCPGFEAVYYNRAAGRVVGGNIEYLEGTNQPYNDLLDYRSNLVLDAVGYVFPWWVFEREIENLAETFARRQRREVLGYIVSTAGISTAGGAEAQHCMLARVDRLCKRIAYETGGMVEFTLLADHGHSYTPGRRIELEEYLTARGWRLTERLRDANDVAYIRFGLETYASFACDKPAVLAADLASAEGVDLVTYADANTVIVLDDDGGRAVISARSGRYRYQPTAGDPLELLPILAALPSRPGGWHEADALLHATAEANYPAPLQRLWRAHFALVENPPDVTVSLEDGWYSGSRGLDRFVDVVSTHGSLNRRNSITFVMSTGAPLPELMRARDVPAALEAMLGRPFPGREK